MIGEMESTELSSSDAISIQQNAIKLMDLMDFITEKSNETLKNYLKRNANILQNDWSDEGEDEDEDGVRKVKKKRKVAHRRASGKWNEEKKKYVRLEPRQSTWYIMYVESDSYSTDAVLAQQFRMRFRMPRPQFIELVLEAKESNWFPDFGLPDATGRPGSPIELLILGSLRYMGRGWTFDDLEEATGISKHTHRKFFHKFIEIGSTILFDRWVCMPKTEKEINDCLHEYEQAGFPGCIGSADATHILMEKCYARLRNHNCGGKERNPTRAFNIVVNHRRRILATTDSFPGRWNDKSIVKFDKMLAEMHAGKLYNEKKFKLNIQGKTIYVQGLYVLVDNGYLNWSATIPPLKDSTNLAEMRWSKWLESLRKDVECTFGILKGRWRILKTGIRLEGFRTVDNIWKTCCALHNWLLDIDGLDEQWKAGTLSEYQCELGLHSEDDAAKYVPKVMHRLTSMRSESGRQFDPTFLGVNGIDADGDYARREEEIDDALDLDAVHNADGNTITYKRIDLSLKALRNLLIKHFDEQFRKRAIRWPSRTGIVEWIPLFSVIE